MPSYDFICPEHGVVEMKYPMSEIKDAAPSCPACDTPMTRKYHKLRVNKRQPLGSKGEIYTDPQSAEDQMYAMITEDYESGD